jgi:hypothetical protein
MGWQDAPEVGSPAWAASPLVEAPPNPLRDAARETSGPEAFAIGAGRFGDRIWEGLKETGYNSGWLMSQLLPDRLRQAAQESIEKRAGSQFADQADKTERYKALTQERPWSTLAGEIAPTLALPMMKVAQGAGAIPAMLNAATSAAVPAALEYGSTGERLERGALAAVGGAVGTAAMKAGAKVLQPVSNMLTPETARLAGEAQKMGIPLTAGDKTGNKAMKTIEAVMQEMPSTSGTQTAIQQAKREAFTKAVMTRLGEDTGEATSATVSSARARIGGDFDRIFSKMSVPLDTPQTQDALGKIIQDANATLPADTAKVVANRVNQLLEKVDANGNVPGPAYQAWRTEVQKQASSAGNGWLSNKLHDVYRAVDQAAYDAATQAGESANLSKARMQYRDLLAIEPLVDKSTDGRISPGLLMGAANKSGTDGLKEVGKVGKAFVMDQVANSGSAQRAAAQAMLSGGLGVGVGGVTYGLTQDPMEALKMGSAAAAGRYVLPRAAQVAINSGAGQKYLTQGVGRPLTPIERALMERAIRVGAISSATGLAEQ